MSLHFYCPTRFEIPFSHSSRTKTFGMGEASARALARKLSLASPSGHLIFFGCAGAINPSIKEGECFLISQIGKEKLSLPKSLKFLPQARLQSVLKPITSREEKHQLWQQTNADLIDCEMDFFLEEASEALLAKCIFIRGVSDSASHSLRFLDGFKFLPQKLIDPRALWDFSKFTSGFIRYRQSIKDFLDRVEQAL